MDPVTMGIVGGTGRIHAAPTLVAFGKGYFQEEGVDVDLVETGGARTLYRRWQAVSSTSPCAGQP